MLRWLATEVGEVRFAMFKAGVVDVEGMGMFLVFIAFVGEGVGLFIMSSIKSLRPTN